MSRGNKESEVDLFARTGLRAIAYLVLAAVAAYPLYIAWSIRARTALLRDGGVKTSGKIVEMKRRFRLNWRRGSISGARRRYQYDPVVEFIDKEGNARRVETWASDDGLIPQPVGRRVTVIHAGSNPDIAEIWAIHNDATIPSTAYRVYIINPHPGYAFHIALFFTSLFGLMGVYSLSGPIQRGLTRPASVPKRGTRRGC